VTGKEEQDKRKEVVFSFLVAVTPVTSHAMHVALERERQEPVNITS